MSERLRKIIEQIDIQPSDRVLEIGCGHGIAAAFICEHLVDGHLLAVDRSAKMIEVARRRNVAHAVSGRAQFLIADIEALNFGERRFEKILAVRLGLFHREPERARKLVERWLAPGGRVLAVYDQP